jgi:hypothetical protein
MRFRAKFGAFGYVSAGLAIFFAILCISSPHPARTGTFALPIFILSLQHILNHFLVYWDVDSDRLHERRLWRTTDVVWSEITYIGYWGKTSQLSIDHCRNAPMSDGGRIIANPEEQSEFINAIRRFAPQATIEA